MKGWLSRELKRGYQLGQTWYLVSSAWWRQWQDYVSDNVCNYSVYIAVSLVVSRQSKRYKRSALLMCSISLDKLSSLHLNELPIKSVEISLTGQIVCF